MLNPNDRRPQIFSIYEYFKKIRRGIIEEDLLQQIPDIVDANEV
ncbi:MAG TPA: hypothetical protein VI278_00885 [Nitrososphaeraceae archaeon]